MKIIQKECNKFSEWVNTQRYIVLHHTWCEGSGNVEYLCNWDNQASCHYLVMKTGQIYQFWTHDKVFWHAWKWERKGIKNTMNYEAVGIEIESTGTSYTPEQKKAVEWLLINIWFSYEDIIRHKDYAPNRKTDLSDPFRCYEFRDFSDYVLYIKIKRLIEMKKELESNKISNSKIYHLTTTDAERIIRHQANEHNRKKLSDIEAELKKIQTKKPS